MLYLDEDVAVVLAPMLAARGYAATTTLAEERTGTTDREQLLYATERKLVLVTHNTADFAELATRFSAEGRHHAGMILCVRPTATQPRRPHQRGTASSQRRPARGHRALRVSASRVWPRFPKTNALPSKLRAMVIRRGDALSAR